MLFVACVEPIRLHTLLTAAVVPNARELRTVRQFTDSSSGQHRPTDLQKWHTEKNTAHTQRIRSRGSSVETHEKGVTVSGVASNRKNEPQNNVARSPRVPVSMSPPPEPHLTRYFNPRPFIWHRGPRPKAHWYMCTDGNHYNYSPLS